jgi:hypothetical protein
VPTDASAVEPVDAPIVASTEAPSVGPVEVPTVAPIGAAPAASADSFDPESLFRPTVTAPAMDSLSSGSTSDAPLDSAAVADQVGMSGLGLTGTDAEPADSFHAAVQRDQMSMKIVLFIALGMALVVVLAVLLILL